MLVNNKIQVSILKMLNLDFLLISYSSWIIKCLGIFLSLNITFLPPSNRLL